MEQDDEKQKLAAASFRPYPGDVGSSQLQRGWVSAPGSCPQHGLQQPLPRHPELLCLPPSPTSLPAGLLCSLCFLFLSLKAATQSFLHLLSYVITEAPPALLLGSALASSGSVWGLAGSESDPALPRARLPSQVPGAKQEPPQPRG